MDLLPLWYQYTIIGIFGLILGSFLNVVIYRFHTGRSLSGSSHCLSCGVRLRWFELFPLLSYLCLRGKCRSCGCHIPARYFLVELMTALMAIVIFSKYALTVPFGIVMLLGVVLLIITVYDMYHMVIPDELVVATTVCAVLYIGYTSIGNIGWEIAVRHGGAALGASAFYGSLWLISKGRWIGFGDVKLALPLGFILGPLGTFSFIVFSFWIGALVSICILTYPRVQSGMMFCVVCVKNIFRTCPHAHVAKNSRYFTMKSEVPFAPFMVVAFLLVFLCDVYVLQLMAKLI